MFKPLHHLTQSLGNWRRHPLELTGRTLAQTQDHPCDPLPSAPSCPLSSQPPPNFWERLHDYQPIRQLHPPFMFGLAVASLTSVVGYRFYNQPQLSVGTISPITVVAPRSESFPDAKSTEEQRKAVRSGIIPMLMRDRNLTLQIKADLKQSLQQIDDWRHRLQSLPHHRTTAQLDETRQRYQQLAQQMKAEPISFLPIDQLTAFLSLSDQDWQLTQSEIQKTAHRILSQGIPPGLPDPILREAIQSHLTSTLPRSSNDLASQLLLTKLRHHPTLIVDPKETKYRAEAAAQAIQPIVVSVKKGETMVTRGDKITQADFVLLDGFGLSRRRPNWSELLVTILWVSGGIILLCRVSKRSHRPLRRRDHLLLCILSLSVPVMSLINPRYSPLPAVAILVSSYYGAPVAVTQVLLLGSISAFALDSIAWEYLLGGIAGSLLAAFFAGRLRSRYELALLGGCVGLVQGTVYFVGHLILSASATTIWYVVLPSAALYGLAGMVWSVIALGLSPYLEHFFDVVTPTRLVELSDPNSPLLKRLATETPGTFQHTLFVSCLAEAAARELHCNVELVRAGTLYHDIGKMHDPLGFIENQMGQANKHDWMNDPRKSVEIIKKHVSEGLIMARKYHLPRVVKNFIPEHQGTLLISYFYYQAQQQAVTMGLDPSTIQESDFRYAGPIPQSRETGIVMLADGCEAALRSLKDATPESALIMTTKVFKARWREGQLSESGLKYEELPLIAEIFVRVWQQFHHQRIAYPKAALDPQGVKS